MSLPIFQRTIVDSSGNIQPGASVAVRNETTGDLVPIFADREGSTAKANPFLADAEGFATFYVEPGEYQVTATTPAGSITWSHVAIGDTALLELAQPTGSALVGFQQSGAGAVVRTVESKGRECVTVLDFVPPEHHEGIRAGTSLYDCGAAFSLAASYAAIVTRVGTANNDIVSAAVEIPAGVYRSSVSLPIKNAVQWQGAGSGATCIVITGAVNGFTVDDPVRDYSNVWLVGFTLENGGAGLDGFAGSGLIRNCGARDVVVKQFRDNWAFTDTWTFKLQDCAGYNATRHHINAGTGTGGLHIYGGRYDVAASHGIYMNATAGELIVVDAAVQFNSGGAVWVDNARTVELEKCFFEGNCIGNPAAHYVTLKRTGANTQTSVTLLDCVMNNLADSNRNGLGIFYAENFRLVNYRERWTRNEVSTVPEIGAGCEQVYVEYSTANARTPVLGNIGVGSANQASVKQTARPQGIYGQDMADVSFAPTTRAALNVGFPLVGVALGTHASTGTVQAYGAAKSLKLNPADGDILLGQAGAKIEDGTNEFFGRYREAIQITSSNITPAATTSTVFVNCSAGGRTVTLANIAHLSGRRVTIKKTDGGANVLIVQPGSGTIDGAASFTSTAAYASITLISDGTNWFSV